MTLAQVATPPAQPAQGRGIVGRVHPKGGAKSGGVQDHFYAFPGRPEVVASDAMITDIVLVQRRDASVLFDPGST